MENDILIDFRFRKEKPRFGELFLITGEEHPKFPPRSRTFEELAPIGFEQLEDFFGILNDEDKGDDVVIWMFPMVKDEEVFQHSGPFDALRLSYSALRNIPAHIALLAECFNQLKALLDADIYFEGQVITSFAPVEKKVDEVIAFWRENGIEPGSEESLLQDAEDDDDWEDEEWEEDEDWEEDQKKPS